MDAHHSLPNALKVLVFDCDGVIFDSKEANVKFYNHVLEHVGHPPVTPQQREYIHMHTVEESLLYLLGPGGQYDEAIRYSKTIDFRMFNRYLQCQPGLVETLKLAKGAYHIALATNRTVSTRDILADFELDHYFDLIVSASDVRFPKPHPETMRAIMKFFGVLPEEILYIGDSHVDEALARATGVFFVAYRNSDLNADLHIRHFGELHPLLFG